ncbi:putative membrane protein [Algoriphagus boseongensis]|uniref:Putative membrane protein n=1 Tax=Algoriphagus boseongensis TaxID=1442587 RepID=A0A4R6T668_9BACT|nr:c-type cytochrome domain-containing protein [Algoriphagus boseongensis]TDQ17529.1 putative membrane protein [Algoriphagus boseongensis]
MNILLQSDSTLFFGRFHSLIVHLPIGFLILGAAFFLLSYFKKYNFLIKALPIILTLGAISALFSVIIGFLLAEEGGYPEQTLFWHRWMGIAVALGSFGALYFVGKVLRHESPETNSIHLQKEKKRIGLILGSLVLLISVTGHLGGTLTHGENYLVEYAPEFLKNLITNGEGENSKSPMPSDPDSTLVFQHILIPAITQKCASCHNESEKKGGLDLSSFEAMQLGGDNGSVFEKGSPHLSELFTRVTLDPSSRKYMPPKGDPLSFSEITLLSFWIENGMPLDLSVTSDEIPENIKLLIQEAYQVSTQKKPYYEKVKVDPVTEEVLNSIRENGFKVEAISEENNLLEVVAKGKLTQENITSLQAIQGQITWLDLGESGIEDSWLSSFDQFSNLTRLVLDNNSITDKAMIPLGKLEHLESINLYNTSVGDSGLKILLTPKSLKRIYLWNTKVSQEVVDSLIKEHPGLLIDMGVAITAKESEKPTK